MKRFLNNVKMYPGHVPLYSKVPGICEGEEPQDSFLPCPKHTPGSSLVQWLSACGLRQQQQPQDHWGFLRNANSQMSAYTYRIRNGLAQAISVLTSPWVILMLPKA